MFFTYILQSEKNGKYYIGYTQNIQARLEKHNNKGSKWTSTGIPWIIVFTKQFNLKLEAIKYERYLKKLKSRIALEKIIAGWRSGISPRP